MSSKAASAMSEDNKSALVPRLRFPEFREAEGWAAKSLKNTCAVNPSNSELPEKFAYIDLESVEAGELKARKIINRDEAPSRAQRLLRYGDVIFQIVRPYQRNNLHFKINEEIPYVASTGYAQLRANESEDFLFQAVHTDNFVERVIAKCTGSNYPAINSSDLADISLAIPNKAEQQKIADCLSSLDELITAEAQNLEALKTHKKGLMQQLFPREGETVPRRRFPDFREEVEWQKRRVSDLLTRSVRPVDVDVEATYQEIGIRSHGKGIFHKELVQGKNLGDKRVFWVEENAFVVNIVFAWEQAVAVTSAAEKGMIASHRFPMYKAKKRKSDVDFIRYFFLTKKGKELLGIASPGGAGRNKTLGQKEFEKLEFLCPEHVEEQAEIAHCLSSLDDLITAQGKKIDALKIHKKGLMQQLFPVLDEEEA